MYGIGVVVTFVVDLVVVERPGSLDFITDALDIPIFK